MKGDQEVEETVEVLDGSIDLHGRPAIRKRSGRWVAGVVILCKLTSKPYTSYSPIYRVI